MKIVKEYNGFQCFITTPDGFDATKEKLPLLVFLHGAGERGEDIKKVKVHGIPKLFNKDVNYHGLRVITLSPQCKEDDTWNWQPRQVKQLIDTVATEYTVDPSRISLTGLSMGGFGTWELASMYPHFFSAIAPICGGGASWFANVLKDLSIWAFHGDADSVVPVFYTQDMIRVIRNNGGNPKMTIYAGVDHDSWTQAYEQTNVIEWLVSQQKK